MKKILAALSAVLLALLCICVPVNAHELEKNAKDFASGTSLKLSVPDIDGKKCKDFRIVLSKKGKLNIKLTCEVSAVYVRLYDEDGEEIKYWIETSNSAGISKIESSIELDKGTYYVRIDRTHRTGSGDAKLTMTYPSSKSASSSKGSSLPAVVLKKGGKVELGALAGGKDGGEVELSTSDKKVAKVDSDGVVTAVSSGTAVITVKNGKNSYKIGVIVK